MRSADLRILQTARRWAETSPIWLRTLLRTYGSSPRPPAAMMVITGDGRYCGSLSGGCIKETSLCAPARVIIAGFSSVAV